MAGPSILGASDKSGSQRPVVGRGDHIYEVIHDWGELPDRIRWGNCHGVAVDADGLVYIHHTVHASSESSDATVVFDAAGKFVRSFAPEFKGGAHGFHLCRENGEQFLYMCDIERRIVVKTTLGGEEVFRLGYPDESPAYQPSSGGERPNYRPTNLAVAPNGDLYIGDGYGSSYVLQFSQEGKYIRTFGGPGADNSESKQPGHLLCPHGILCDERGQEPVILVADRSNNRLQSFTLAGEHIGFDYGVKLPCHFDVRGDELLVPDLAARVTLMDRNNQVIVHLGEGSDDYRERRLKSREHFPAGKFVCPHGACYDPDGNIFVVEWVEIGRVTKLRKLG